MTNKRKPYAPVNRVFVSADKRWEDEIETASGIKLYKDTTYQPEWGVSLYGTVETLPLQFKKDFQNEGVEPGITEGDKAYFHYFTLIYDENRISVDGKDYYMVDYHRIFVVIRDGVIIPVHGWTLIEVDNEFTGDKTKGGIIIPQFLRRKKVDTYGKLKYISQNQRSIGASPGDTVFFQKEFAFENRIEGTDYYVIQENDIMAYEKAKKK